MKKLLTVCMVAAFVLAVSSVAQSATLEVRPPGGTGILGDVYTNIQDAIDDASDGDTIIIHNATYVENIDVNKRITLQGEGSGDDPASDTIITAAVGNEPTIQIQASGASGSVRLVISDMRVTGATGSGNPGSGIEFDSGSGSYTTLQNVAAVGNGGNGIATDIADGSVHVDLELIDCNMSNNGSSGFNLNSTDTFDGLTITNCVAIGNLTSQGMYLEGPITGLNISGGTYSNNGDNTWDDTGIYANQLNASVAFTKKACTIQNVVVSDNPRGVFLNICGGPSLVIDNVTANNNDSVNAYEIGAINVYTDMYGAGCESLGSLQITNCTADNAVNSGIMVKASGGVDEILINQAQLAGNKTGIYMKDYGGTITDATISDCNVADNTTGIEVVGTPTGVSITGNDILNNGATTGIVVGDGAAAGSEAHNNCIVGNGVGVSNLDLDDEFDATGNAWGDASGPNHPVTNTSGLGDEVSDGVAYYPWYPDCTFTSLVYRPVHNVTIDAYYDTVQGAIDEASDGDEITADPCTYNETVTINVDNLTIIGIEGSLPTITGGVTLVGVSGLSMENFVITGNGGSNSVIRMTGAVTDLALDNCVLDGENVAGRMGLTGGQLEGDVTITNCELKNLLGWAVLDSRSGSGGDGSAMGTVTFADNNIHHCNGSIVFRGLSSDRTDVVNAYGNTWNNIGGNSEEAGQHWAALEINRAVAANVYGNTISGVTEGEWGEGQALQVWDIDTLDVYDNTLTGNFQGIYVHGSDPAYGGSLAVPGGAIYCNTISGNSDYGISVDPSATGGPLNAELNWWGDTSGPSGSGGGTGDAALGDVDFFPWLLSSDCNDLTEVVADYVVDDDWEGQPDWATVEVDGTDYYIGLNAFDTIQKAVDAASDGNSIRVLEGEYVGAVVNEDLTITGANPGGSVITSGVAYKAGSDLETAFRVDEDADGASISSFTVDCNRADNFFFAVFARAADEVTIDSLIVNKPVQGISVYGANDCKITNNVLNETEAAGGGGIAIYIAARPPDYPVLQRNLVKNNVITAAATAPDFTCPGIALCLDLRYGAYGALTGSEDLSYNKISNNTIMANYTDNEVGIEMGVIIADDEPNRPDKVAAMLGKIHDNQIRNNIIDGANLGVYVYTVADLIVLGNELADCNEGVHLEDVHRGVAISYNTIYGSATYGVNNATGTVVDATYNWWGDVSGPADPCGTSETDGVDCHDVSTVKNADGLGDAVTADVEYCPWLVAPPSSSDSPLPAGDVNFDGCINWLDLAALAEGWLDGCEE